MNGVGNFGRALLASASLAVLLAGPAQAQLREAIGVSQQAVSETAESQGRIDQIDDATSDIVREYRAVLKQLDRLRRYNASLRQQIRSQENEIASLRDQIDNVASLQRDVVPLMTDMVDALEKFVANDVPFLASERSTRVANLKALMSDVTATNADRYRRIIEAYEIENEYGRTIEAYEAPLPGDEARVVEFLRVGRVTLVYRTKDGDDMGVWNQQTRSWETLDGSYATAIRNGIRMAKEEIPPNLLTIPAPPVQDAS